MERYDNSVAVNFTALQNIANMTKRVVEFAVTVNNTDEDLLSKPKSLNELNDFNNTVNDIIVEALRVKFEVK